MKRSSPVFAWVRMRPRTDDGDDDDRGENGPDRADREGGGGESGATVGLWGGAAYGAGSGGWDRRCCRPAFTERIHQRYCYREQAQQTRADRIDLSIPKLQMGSYFPSFLETRRIAEKTMTVPVQEAGACPRAKPEGPGHLDDLVKRWAIKADALARRRSKP